MIDRIEFEKDFEAFISSMRDTLIAKNHDYTSANKDPLYNFKKADNIGIEPYRGAILRFLDKVSRLETFSKRGVLVVKDESINDTLKDAANYLFLISELIKEAKNETNKTFEDSSRLENITRAESVTNNNNTN